MILTQWQSCVPGARLGHKLGKHVTHTRQSEQCRCGPFSSLHFSRTLCSVHTHPRPREGKRRPTQPRGQCWTGGPGGLSNSRVPSLIPLCSPCQRAAILPKKAFEENVTGKLREVGGGFGTGDTYIPAADSCRCMAKTTTTL